MVFTDSNLVPEWDLRHIPVATFLEPLWWFRILGRCQAVARRVHQTKTG